MKTTPLLMKGPLVLSSLRGEKTQTRRLKGLDYYNKNPDQFELADKEGWLKAKPHCTKGSAPKGPILRNRETGDLTSVPSPYGYKGDCHSMTCYWHSPEQAVAQWNRRVQNKPANCSHPECGAFRDPLRNGGWSCRAMADDACAADNGRPRDA